MLATMGEQRRVRTSALLQQVLDSSNASMRLVGQHLPDRYVQGWRIGKVRDEPEVRRVAGEGCVETFEAPVEVKSMT